MASNKFHHEQIYRGTDYVERLNRTALTVCGAGALGSNLVDTLSRQGYSNITVIDMDRVEAHNIGTQVYGDPDVGALKAVALKNRVFRQTGLEITGVSKELTGANVKQLLGLGKAGLVVDVFDNTGARLIVQDYCTMKMIPCVHAGLFADYGEVIWRDKYKVPPMVPGQDVCDYPLARNLISILVAVLAEEVLDFCLASRPRYGDWSFTLKDLALRRLDF